MVALGGKDGTTWAFFDSGRDEEEEVEESAAAVEATPGRSDGFCITIDGTAAGTL